MFRPDYKIGPYTLVRQLGRGAFGIVWLAEKRTAITTTSFALKIAIDQEPDLDAVRQEADLWKQAGGHPNVLPIIEADIYDGYVVIVSEYAPDGSLEESLKRSDVPFTIDKSAEIVSGILAGLHHLHTRGIIHRDLKPANILFQGETPRLADFGIARVLKTDSYSATVAGTPVYMAPEAFDGKRSVQTDIWAAGVILHRLISGRLPYPQSDMMALMAAIMSHDPQPLASTIPQPVREIVACALNKNPERRYKSAAEMREALSAASQSSIGTRLVEKATPTDLRTTVRTPIVIPIRDDVDESTIVRPRSERKTIPNHDSNVENGSSQRMPIAISLEHRIDVQPSKRLMDALPRYDRPFKPSIREVKKEFKGLRLIVGFAALLAVSLFLVFFFVRNYSKPGAANESGSTQPMQPVDMSSIREAVMTTLNGWVTATKTGNVETCMSFFADRLDTYYSLRSVSSDKVRSDLTKAFSNYSSFDVQLSNVEITPDQSGTGATATFDKTFNFQGQKYFSGTVHQRLRLANIEGRWRITGLRELSVYAKNSGVVGERDGNTNGEVKDSEESKGQLPKFSLTPPLVAPRPEPTPRPPSLPVPETVQVDPRLERKRDERAMGGGNPWLGGGIGTPATAVDQQPILLNNPVPRYTEVAKRNKIQGTVTARVLIGADGTVKQVKIVRGLPDGLDEQAIQAAYQLRFRPATKNGSPVAFWRNVQIEFNLR